MRRTTFALFLIVLFALVCAPDISRRFIPIDAPWLGWVQAILLAAGVVAAARARLRDAGKPEAWLLQVLLVVTPIYALFASPLAGLLPVPSQLSTLALIGANGAVFGGLIFMALMPSAEIAERTEEPKRRDAPKPDSDSGAAPVPAAADSAPASPSAKPAPTDDTRIADQTSADTSSGDASSDGGSGGDGGGGGGSD